MTVPSRRFEDHPHEQWTPVRTLHADAPCFFCGRLILRGSPGRTMGTRGTRCWWNAARREYECLDCRSEAMRAEETRHTHPLVPVMERCLACFYGRMSDDRGFVRKPFRLLACGGCELGPGRGIHRICPRCGHVEHRAYGQARASQVAA